MEELLTLASSTALLGTVPWLGTLHAAKRRALISPTDRVRIDMTGISDRGQFLLNFLLDNPAVEVAAICDDYAPQF